MAIAIDFSEDTVVCSRGGHCSGGRIGGYSGGSRGGYSDTL